MKHIAKYSISLALLVIVVLAVSGCATSEKPNFQGYKHAAPTIEDYYPSKPR